jgi:uncharacterized protein (TIGR02302 family)
MTPLSHWTGFRPGSKAEPSERYIAAARLAILWERVWPALWPASGIAGLFLAAALCDLFAALPGWLHSLILLVTVFGAGTVLHGTLRGLTFPSWDEGARRVERDSALAHRPLSEGHDVLALGSGDAWTQALWRAHLRRLLASIAQLRVGLPAPGLARRDPYALRFAVLLAVAAGFAVAGSDWDRRIALALTPDAGSGSAGASLDSWINPPPYTGEAPLYLPAIAGTPVTVPAGSELVLRVHAASARPHLQIKPDSDDWRPRFTGTNGEYGVVVPLPAARDVRVLADGRLLGRWHVDALAAGAPFIAFAEPPSKTERAALKIVFRAGDRYGVTAARAIIRPVAAHSHAVLSVDLPLAASSAKTLTQTVYRDLTDEPLAGVDVEIVLEAKNGAGESGYSKPARIRLPARTFTDPLARALIEQRQTLALAAPPARDQVARTLDALTLAPEAFYAHQPQIYLALRTAYWTTANLRGGDDAARVQHILWDTAVALEQGVMLSAAEQLRRLQQMLSQALAQGAPQEVIDALLERYRQALQAYLQALAQNAPQGAPQEQAGGKSINGQDLDAMLKAIQKMAQTGSREAAAQALAMLQSLIENMQVTAGKGGRGAPGDKALSDAIQGLGDLIGKQRELLDKTYRQGQGAGDPKDGGPHGLAQSQGKLRRDLDRIARALQGGRTPAPRTLDKAGRSMGDAQSQLDSQALDSAGQTQKEILDALRDAAGELAKALMKESGQDNAQGEGKSDPLGRAQSPFGTSGSGVKIPDRDALQRARSILEELRRRAAERGRPKQELEYYDRLLKAF